MVFIHQNVPGTRSESVDVTLSHKYGLYYSMEYFAAMDLITEHEEALFLFSLKTAARVICWAEWSEMFLWPCLGLSISGSGDRLLGGYGAVGGGEKEKLSCKLEAKYPYISWNIIFDNIHVNISLIKLWTGTFYFLILTTELVPWLGAKSQIRSCLNSF